MVKTFSTDFHDFYCESPNIIKPNNKGRLYNIVPRGHEVPTKGYFSPRIVLDIFGYKDLTVRECFIDYFIKNI